MRSDPETVLRPAIQPYRPLSMAMAHPPGGPDVIGTLGVRMTLNAPVNNTILHREHRMLGGVDVLQRIAGQRHDVRVEHGRRGPLGIRAGHGQNEVAEQRNPEEKVSLTVAPRYDSSSGWSSYHRSAAVA